MRRLIYQYNKFCLRLTNLIFAFKWTDCKHKRRTLVNFEYFKCIDCGATFTRDYNPSLPDLQVGD